MTIEKRTAIYSDLYNAQIFYDMFKDNVVWCSNFGGWQIYKDGVWSLDESSEIQRLSIKAYHAIAERMRQVGDSHALSHAKKSAGLGSLKNTTELAKAFMGITAHKFDTNKYYINCLNGTYCLDKYVLVDHNPSHLITKKANVVYDPNAKCPLWRKFIKDICVGREDLMLFLQRVFGYGITDDIKEQCIFILYGNGNNGKSTLTDTIEGILSDFCKRLPSDILINKGFNSKDNPGDIARLKGSRVVLASETDPNVTLSEKLIKAATGDGKILARFLYQDSFEFTPTFKIFLSTNNKPNVRGTDEGIWRRIKMIPFDLKLNKSEIDRNLLFKLRDEYSGIFNWIIEGHKMYRQEGLNPPDIVNQTTELYREEEDDLGQFIDDHCMLEKNSLYESHKFKEEFKKQMGYYKGTKTINEYMARKGFKPMADNRFVLNGKQVRCYVNIRPKTEYDILKENAKQNTWLD